MLKLCIVGAGGRMGRAVLLAAAQFADVKVTAAIVRSGSSLIGEDVGRWLGGEPKGLAFSASLDVALTEAEVVIDFSAPHATAGVAAACLRHGRALVCGTTGLDEAARDALHQAARAIPVVQAPNMSLGVNVALALVERAARALGETFDAEILDVHHAAKRDAPSGTALALGEAIATARGRHLEELAVHARHGQIGARAPGLIGFAVVRGGDVAGEHRVMFLGPGERLEISHAAADRSVFARGALAAARWVRGRAPGLYDMRDVLGLRA